jgi:uncharacterized protein YndB with AHSA1/START domain
VTGFGTQIPIAAAADTVWSLLTDAAGYPDWNSTVARIEGRIAPGAKLTLHAKASSGRAFPLRVSVFEAPARMVWTGGMPLGPFTGLMAWLITRSMGKMLPAFNAFAADLKRAAEATG